MTNVSLTVLLLYFNGPIVSSHKLPLSIPDHVLHLLLHSFVSCNFAAVIYRISAEPCRPVVVPFSLHWYSKCLSIRVFTVSVKTFGLISSLFPSSPRGGGGGCVMYSKPGTGAPTPPPHTQNGAGAGGGGGGV